MNYMEGMTDEAEKVTNQDNRLELHTTIRKLSGKYDKPEKPVKDKTEQEIPDEVEE